MPTAPEPYQDKTPAAGSPWRRVLIGSAVMIVLFLILLFLMSGMDQFDYRMF